MNKKVLIFIVAFFFLDLLPIKLYSQTIIDLSVSGNYLITSREDINRKFGGRAGVFILTQLFHNFTITNGLFIDIARKNNHEICSGSAIDTCDYPCPHSSECLIRIKEYCKKK